MKKVLLSILTFIYLGVSSGLAMEVHYCMGKQAGVDFYGSSSDDRCSRCGMIEKDTGCCHDEHSFYKLTIDQKHVVNDISFDQPVFAIVSSFSQYKSDPIDLQPMHSVANHSPPIPVSGAFTCILHGVFRL